MNQEQKILLFQDTILSYYDKQGRDLPFRNTTNLYHIAVSEFMLQQTQVSRVIEKYTAFIKAFPTPKSLAQASQKQVLSYWQGLGYNRRAKYVQNLAVLLTTNPNPSYQELLEVKGVGPYTAAAIRVFARNENRVAPDVNVKRVHKRFFNTDDKDFMLRVLPENNSRIWHNAVMDFSSDVCTKQNPSCTNCPLKAHCYAYKHDTFADEKTRSQKKFLGSIRWHRGQIVKKLLTQPMTRDELFDTLDESVRDTKKFASAIDQLRQESFLQYQDDQLVLVE